MRWRIWAPRSRSRSPSCARWRGAPARAAASVGAVIWLAEDFGAIFTGQGTDPNSGLLLIVAAAAFWPFADVPPREADHAQLTSATRARTRWASPAARAHRSATKRLAAS